MISERYKWIALIFLLTLSGCNYNPFIRNNQTTGSPTAAAVGAGVGAGSVALLRGPNSLIVLAGLGGGAAGYYATTLRYDAGGVLRAGGKVYKVGDVVGIYLQTDNIFESNTANFLPQAAPALDSAAAVLKRYPANNIVISGNTSGFYRSKWEQRLSERRAQKVAGYLWNAGVNQFKEPGTDTRKLTYVGYGDYFPIATHLTNIGIRENSRIQITSYPSDCDLEIDGGHQAFNNVSRLNDAKITEASHTGCYQDDTGRSECFK